MGKKVAVMCSVASSMLRKKMSDVVSRAVCQIVYKFTAFFWKENSKIEREKVEGVLVDSDTLSCTVVLIGNMSFLC